MATISSKEIQLVNEGIVIPNPREFINEEEQNLARITESINKALSEGKLDEARDISFQWVNESFKVISAFKEVLNQTDEATEELEGFRREIEELQKEEQPKEVTEDVRKLLRDPHNQIRMGKLPLSEAVNELRKVFAQPEPERRPAKQTKKGMFGGLIK